MGTFSNTSLGNILFIATIGTSSTVAPLPYEIQSISSPSQNVSFVVSKDVKEWSKDLFLQVPSYSNEEYEKVRTIIAFSEKLIQNTKDIDSEYVDIVNENFWDLI